MTFYDGANAIGNGTVSNGVATLSTTGLALNGHSITAAYTPDTANYKASPKSSALSLNVTKDGTVATVTSSLNPAYVGQTVTFTATVGAAAPGTATPTGTVTFYNGSLVLGTVTLSNGRATLSTAGLTLGSHNITARYAGSTVFNASTSANLSQSIQVQTVKTLAATVNPAQPTVGQPFSISVQALDPNGQIVAGNNNLVYITVLSHPAGGTLTGAVIARFSHGQATFANLGVTAAGPYTIRITSNGLSLTLTINTNGRLS